MYQVVKTYQTHTKPEVNTMVGLIYIRHTINQNVLVVITYKLPENINIVLIERYAYYRLSNLVS